MGWMEDALVAASGAPQEVSKLFPDVVPGRHLLVDGDMIAYACSGKEGTSPGEARRRAINRIETMRDMSGSEKVTVHLTSEASTKGDRYIVATVRPYQEERNKSKKKPANWRYLREWMETYSGDLFKVKTWGTREADDGICYHAIVLGAENSVVASDDKDLRMIPAWHIDWRTYELVWAPDTMFRVYNTDRSKMYGRAWFWHQVIRGDPVDKIPGVPEYLSASGKWRPVGDKTADKFIDDCLTDDECMRVAAELYKQYYGYDDDVWADRMVEQMSLLWMRRYAEGAVDDFVGWMVYERNNPTHVKLFDAAARMVTRVKEAKEAVL